MTKNAEVGKTPKKSMPAGASKNGTAPGGPKKTPIDGASINDLSKRLGEIEGVNEDMAMFLAHNWQKLAGGLFVVLIGAFLYHQYRNTQNTRMGDAAQRFELASTEFGKLLDGSKKDATPPTPADPEKKEEPKPEVASDVVLFEQLKLLQSTQSDTIYGRLAGLYAAQARLSQKNFDAARTELQKFNTSKFAGITKPKLAEEVKSNNLVDELAALENARLSIEEGKASPKEIEQQLTSLIYGGRFTNLEALLVLFRVSQTPEQRAAAGEAAKSLLSARPELREIITTQLASNGFSVD